MCDPFKISFWNILYVFREILNSKSLKAYYLVKLQKNKLVQTLTLTGVVLMSYLEHLFDSLQIPKKYLHHSSWQHSQAYY